jgi:hypothetical protein
MKKSLIVIVCILAAIVLVAYAAPSVDIGGLIRRIHGR